MSYLETGQLDEFLSGCVKDFIDMTALKNGLVLLKSQEAMEDNTAAPYVQDKDNRQFYYERNFLDEAENIIVLQITCAWFQ